jgi:hypothetical protein
MHRPHLSLVLHPAALALAFAAVVCASGCSGNDDAGNFANERGGTSNASGNNPIDVGSRSGSGASSNTGGGANVSSGGGNSCQLEDDGSGCVGQAYEGEALPLDIYIMFDQSGSMCSCIDPVGGQACPDPNCAETRLDAVRAATKAFLADPASAGIGVGIGYFGKQPIGSASCDVADYSEPAVPIGTLPDHAPVIMESLSAIQPTGETPSGAAIRGACEYARKHKAAHPEREVVLLLLTDGKPEAPVTCMNGSGPCCPSLADAVEAATACREGKTGIRTYVLGVGPLLGNLADIAKAGGTDRAYLVEGGDVSAEVLEALNRIRGDAIPCEFKLPPPPSGQELNGFVNITYASPTCEPSYYYHVESEADCGEQGGWYYDDDDEPQKVLLCPSSCDQVSEPGGRLLFTVGCTTREVPK